VVEFGNGGLQAVVTVLADEPSTMPTEPSHHAGIRFRADAEQMAHLDGVRNALAREIWQDRL